MSDSEEYFPANEEVYEAFEDFFRGIISDLSLQQIPLRYKRLAVEKVEPRRLVIEPNYRDLEALGRHSNRYEDIDEIVEALLNADYYPQTHEDLGNDDIPFEGRIANYLLDNFWDLYLRNAEELVVFEQSTFDWVFGQMEDYLQRDELPYRAWVFLHNFMMDSSTLKLGGNLQIRELEPEDLNYILEEKYPREEYLGPPMYPTYILECEYTVPKNSPDVSEYPRMEFDRVVTGLRLFEPHGTPEYDRGFAKADFPFTTTDTTRASLRGGRAGIRYNVCELEAAEESDFADFFAAHRGLIKTETEGMFSRSLRRLNQMNEKGDDADCIVDCAIAFEETILKTVTQGASFTFRLRLRDSLLLDGRVPYNRGEIRSFFRALYYARGEIVHSDKPLSEIVSEDRFELETISDPDSREFVQHARVFLAEVIKEYMKHRTDQGLSIADVNEEIDEAFYDTTYNPS